MALENSMLVMNGKQVGGNTQDLTGYQTKVDNNLETESKEIAGAINELRSEKADTDMVASDFDATASYTAGNYCIYEGKFYKFKANHTGAWSAADVDEIKIAGELASLKSGLTNVETLQTISLLSDLVLTGTITIKRNCGVNFVICNNITLRNDLAAGSSVEVCTAGTVENPPAVVTLIPLYAVSGGDFIAPVYLAIRADGGISVYNYSTRATKLYGYCCSAYI